MDERVTAALEFSNYNTTLNLQKEEILTKFKNDIIHISNGGKFKITLDLLSSIKILSEHYDEFYVLDTDNKPVQILNMKEFYLEILNVYNESILEYYVKFNNLKKARNITKLIDSDIK